MAEVLNIKIVCINNTFTARVQYVTSYDQDRATESL